MFERGINTADIRRVLEVEDVIEAYPNDKPYPSRLLLGTVSGRPLHVVAADNPTAEETFIITVYEPDPERWDRSFRRRR